MDRTQISCDIWHLKISRYHEKEINLPLIKIMRISSALLKCYEMRMYPRWTLVLYVSDNWKLTFYQLVFFYEINNINALPYPKQRSWNYQKHASTQSPSNSFRYTVRYWTFVFISDFWNIKRIIKWYLVIWMLMMSTIG